MIALVIARATLTRLLRDRTALAFVVALPVVIILIVGMTVGGFDKLRVGVVVADRGPMGQQLAADLEHAPALAVTTYSDEARARTALRRSEVSAVVVVPAGLDQTAASGGPVTVPVLTNGLSSTGTIPAIDAVVARQAARVQAARFAVAEAGGSFDGRLATATELAQGTPQISTTFQVVNGSSQVLPAGFSYSTPTMLVLFVFVNALAAGGAIVQTRRLGVYERALAAPVSAGSIVRGETLAYLGLALVQSLLIVTVGALAFGVSWGDPLAAAVLITAWALVGTGAGVLFGTVFRTPEQATAIGPTVGIALGMLGGCMWPLSILSPLMRGLGHLAPQAWAVDAWTVLISRHGGLTDIARHLAVLAGFAAALLAVASFRLRRRITR